MFGDIIARSGSVSTVLALKQAQAICGVELASYFVQ
jgi:hypothetical protein